MDRETGEILRTVRMCDTEEERMMDCPEEKKQAVIRLMSPDGLKPITLPVQQLDMKLLPVSMPAPSIKHLEDELRGQTLSLDFLPSEAFQADMRRFADSMRQVVETIAESALKAFRTLVHVLANDPVLSVLVQPTQKPHLSKQSRRYLMVKQRERARRLRHGRKRYA